MGKSRVAGPTFGDASDQEWDTMEAALSNKMGVLEVPPAYHITRWGLGPRVRQRLAHHRRRPQGAC